MSTSTSSVDQGIGAIEERILNEGYGPGAWHGADLKAAIAEVAPELALWRPAPGRHNIAEIALHHAWCVRNVRAQLSGVTAEPFAVDGEDWFPVDAGSAVGWPNVLEILAREYKRLVDVVGHETSAQRRRDETSAADRFTAILGITCHAIYHAGQIQLIKRLKNG